jgi:DNA repair photolyase
MADLPLLDFLDPAPALPGPGMARMAAAGEHLRDGHEVEFFHLAARSILSRCDAPRLPFTWTINPYRGCEMACRYCYARYTHEFLELSELEFEQKIYVKRHAAWLLRQEIGKVKPHEEIALGSATDPYQPAEKRFAVTRSLLEVLAVQQGMRIDLVTKSDLILRDLDLLRRIAGGNRLQVSLTVTTMDAPLARLLEPRAPRPEQRLSAVRELVAAGIAASVMLAPVMPGITDRPEDLEAVVRATAEAGGRSIFANALFLRPCSATIFLPFLEQHFPHLTEDYRRCYRQRAFVSSRYRRRLADVMAGLRRKYGFSSVLDRPPGDRSAASRPRPSEAGGCGPGNRRKQFAPQPRMPLLEDQMGLFGYS